MEVSTPIISHFCRANCFRRHWVRERERVSSKRANISLVLAFRLARSNVCGLVVRRVRECTVFFCFGVSSGCRGIIHPAFFILCEKCPVAGSPSRRKIARGLLAQGGSGGVYVLWFSSVSLLMMCFKSSAFQCEWVCVWVSVVGM